MGESLQVNKVYLGVGLGDADTLETFSLEARFFVGRRKDLGMRLHMS